MEGRPKPAPRLDRGLFAVIAPKIRTARVIAHSVNEAPKHDAERRRQHQEVGACDYIDQHVSVSQGVEYVLSLLRPAQHVKGPSRKSIPKGQGM